MQQKFVRPASSGRVGRYRLSKGATPKSILAMLLILILAAACSTPSPSPVARVEPSPTFTSEPTPTGTPSPTHTPLPTFTSTPTSTPLPTPTPTPEPTSTPTAAPTPTPPPTGTPLPLEVPPGSNTVTVCAEGCDFTSIQAAIDDPGTLAGHVIYVTDAIHTEAGISVSKDVTLQGRGAAYTIIQADKRAGKARDRVFFIPEGATVTIQDLTIRHGNPREEMRSGGGIENRGALTLFRCDVRDNQANCGGGIYNEGGALVVKNSTIRDNVADGEAKSGYGCGSGGAIKVTAGGTLTLANSTLSGNRTQRRGGALHISCNSTAVLVNCTISGNHATSRAGAINAAGTVSLTHCTISGNTAKGILYGDPVSGETAGGVYVRGTLHYSNTLIANHVKGGDCVLGDDGVIGANANNLVEDGSCSPAYAVDPQLAAVAYNGGDTETRALLPGSPAVDAIPASDCFLDADQRGQSRPVAGTSTAAGCDIGAFELQGE